MLRVGKYDYKTKTEPTTENFTNILIHTTGELSPYTMKDNDNVIMENYWQFSKIWPVVYPTEQTISRWDSRIRWKCEKEIHYKDDKITKDYWHWRSRGFSSDRWIRYPNEYKFHNQCIGSVIGDQDDYEIIDYISARKYIYFDKYREIAVKTKQFRQLKERLERGENLQINEVDGPSFCDTYPYSLTVNNSIEIDQNILRKLINTPLQAFGHGYALAACLLGIDLTD